MKIIKSKKTILVLWILYFLKKVPTGKAIAPKPVLDVKLCQRLIRVTMNASLKQKGVKVKHIS